MSKKRRRYGSGSIFKNGRTWWAQYYVAGQRLTESTGFEDRERADQFLKERIAEAAAGRIETSPSRATVADLCRLVLEDNRLRNLRDAKTVEWRFNAHIKNAMGKILASRCTGAHIRAYVQARRAAEASDATINRELSIIRRGFKLAIREDPPVVRKAPYIPKLEEDNVRQGFLNYEQYERLLIELPDRLKALFVCAYHVGTRKGELRKVRWEQVDFEVGVIRLPARSTKNKKPRTLPIYGDMEPWLKTQRASCSENNPFVFHGWRGRPVGDHLDGWAEACERAKLAGLLFHDLRRSAVRNMKRAGIQDGEAMDISGHKTRAVFERYNIIDEVDMENAGEKLEAYFQRRKAEGPRKLKRVK